ncbi:MAG: polyketide cyclase [Nevskia sp.]|nr:polyketide cyclase [Nevskia sp.]
MNARRNDYAAEPSADLELVMTRVFDAPRALVYRAWTKDMSRWSCPRGFVFTHNEGDVRPGGKWRSCMRSPEGKDLWLGGVYREVVENTLLVFTHSWDQPDGTPGHETLVTVKLEDYQGKTRMLFHQNFFDTVASRDGHRGGWGECFELLQEYLAA